MSSILGIDAAWTSHHPSGVALIRQTESGGWESVRVSKSYEEFLELSPNRRGKSDGRKVPVVALIEAARRWAETDVKLIVADIPLATGHIHGLRCADRKVSKFFGGKGCSTHAPSTTRPGRISVEIRDGFQECGFQLATHQNYLSDHALIETYLHPALLSLMKASYRVPYKVGNSKKYWPRLDHKERLVKIAEKLGEILAALSAPIFGIDFVVPKDSKSFSGLKPVEDKIDALVCAWVGVQFLEGKAIAIGDDEAAIWLPAGLPLSARPKDWSAYLSSGQVASAEFMEGVDELSVQSLKIENWAE
jgi:predicted RNase H-like nuclease